MMWSFFHPAADSLSDFASGTLSDREHATIARHLESCSECRETVSTLRAVAQLEHDDERGADNALLKRILTARAAGQRMVLPTADAVEPSSRRHVLGVAVGAAAIVLITVLARGPGEATAGSRAGFLRFDPAAPRPGATLHVSYTPSAALERNDSLLLRTRYRRPGDVSYNYGSRQRRATVLYHVPSGIFAGELVLPDSVVYAAFAVESPSGDLVDDNDEQLWEVVTADSAGRPLFEALVQKQRDLMGRNWELGLKTVRRLAAVYPDDPEAWSLVPVYERWVLGDRVADSLLPTHRRRFAAFQRQWAERPSLPRTVVHGMLSYGIQIDNHDAARYWATRWEQEFPDDPDVLFRQENHLREQYLGKLKDPSAYFAHLEPIWAKAEPVHDQTIVLLAQNAAGEALWRKDTAAMRTWVPRSRRVDQRTTTWAAYWGKALLEYPTLRQMGMSWLREEARLLDKGPDEYRPLTATVSEQRAANRAAAQPILAELARALLQEGDTIAGLDTLRLAASYGLNPSVFRSVAQTWAAHGDTTQALQAYARVAADPGTPAAFSDSIRAMFPNTSVAQWDRWVTQAREEMRAEVLRGAVPKPLNGPTRLLSATGDVRHLSDLAKGRVTVVAFWSPGCWFSVRPLGELARLAERLQRDGVEVVAVVDHPFSAELTRILKEQHAEGLPVFYDYRSDTKRAFVTFSLPDYYVLDSSGRLVFAHSKLEEIPRQVAALLPKGLAATR